MKEIEISLRSLTFYVLKHWKSILLSTLVFMLFFGLYGEMRLHDSRNITISSTISEAEKNYVEATYDYVEAVKENISKNEDSFWTSINIDDVRIRKICYLIKSTEVGDAITTAALIKNILLGDSFTDRIAAETDESAEHAKDMIDVGFSDVSELTTSAFFYINIYSDSAENIDIIAEMVNESVEDNSELLRNGGMNFNVLKISDYTTVGIDETVYQKRVSKLYSVIENTQMIAHLEDGLSDDERKYYEQLSFPDIGHSEDEASNGMVLKYALCGMIAGLFLAVIFHMSFFILANKLDIEDDVESIFGIYKFGVIPGGNKGNIICSLRSLGKRTFGVEESCELIAKKIKVYVNLNDEKKICIIGCEIMKYSDKIVELLIHYLNEFGIEVSVLDNPLYDITSFDSLAEENHVILLEKAEKTIRTEISDEIEMLKKAGISVGGMILIG